MLAAVTVPLSQDGVGTVGLEWYQSTFDGVLSGALMLVGHILAVVFGLVLIRKSKRAEIDRVWTEVPEPQTTANIG